MGRTSRGIEPATGPDDLDTHALSLDASVRGATKIAAWVIGAAPPEGKSKHESDTMGKVLDEDLVYEILSVVAEIPAGCVASYGQIARLIGREKNSRLVGAVLSEADRYGDYPCHRVVNHAGRLAPNFPDQRALLTEEGVAFRDNGCVDMKKHQWNE